MGLRASVPGQEAVPGVVRFLCVHAACRSVPNIESIRTAAVLAVHV